MAVTKPFSEDFKTEPYWWDTAAAPEAAAGALPADADVVVVGSGYTGLHAALQTARAGRATVVVDARAAGWGCSTRNGGQIGTSVKPDLAALTRRFGRERGIGILREGHASLAWMGDFVSGEGIDCDFTACGRFHAAHDRAAFERMARAAGSDPPGLESDAEVVPRASQHRELGSDAYHGGVVYPRHAALDPARYHRGLLQRVSEAGAAIVTGCRVLGVESAGGKARVTTENGTVTAGRVLIATNGYTGEETPWHRRRVIPIGSYMIATEPLAPALMESLMPRRRVVSDSRRVIYYYRPSPDNRRILFGGRVSHNETDPRVSGPKLHRDLVGIFPELAAARITHSWVGFVAYTFDTLAHLGERGGIHYAMGYCGSGVAMGSYLGMRAGQRMLGLAEGATAFDGLEFPARFYYTGNPWFLGAAVRYYRWRDNLGW